MIQAGMARDINLVFINHGWGVVGSIVINQPFLLQYVNGSHTLMCLVYDQSTKKIIFLAWNNSSITANQHIMPNTFLNYINRHLLSFSQLNKTSKASFQIELAGCHSKNIYLFIYGIKQPITPQCSSRHYQHVSETNQGRFYSDVTILFIYFWK